MKKIISIFLAVLFILSFDTIALGAGSVTVDPKTNPDRKDNKIYNFNMLDFEKD